MCLDCSHGFPIINLLTASWTLMRLQSWDQVRLAMKHAGPLPADFLNFSAAACRAFGNNNHFWSGLLIKDASLSNAGGVDLGARPHAAGSLHRAGCEDGRAGRRQDPLFDHGCATLQLCPVPKSTFSGTDSPSFFPVPSISVFTSCFASSKSFSGTSKINSSWTWRIILACGIS